MKRIFFFVMITTLCCAAWAIPAREGVSKRTLPDGTTINVALYGDENFHYLTTEDDYLLVEDEQGYLNYAQMVSGKAVSTGIRAVDIKSRPAAHTQKLLQIGKYKLTDEQLVQARMAAAEEKAARAPQATSAAQAPKGLCILVNFADKSFTHTREEFDDMLNKEGYSDNGAVGSGADYFKSVSDGKYTPHFDVFGPVTLDRNMNYYGQNDSKGGDLHADQMVADACNKLAADSRYSVNFADYDADNDGKVDIVFVYYAGYAESNNAGANTVWPHRWVVYSQYIEKGTNLKFNGKTIADYACGSELTSNRGTVMSAVGTFCHEFSHVLGLPDFYSTTGGSYKTLGRWDLMDYGCYNNDCKTPCGYTAYEKFYCGWITPTILKNPVNAVLYDFSSSGNAFVITSNGKFNNRGTSPSPAEFYILENRQQIGWDAAIPYHGMLIYKVQYSAYYWRMNQVNDSETSMRMDLIESYPLNYYTADQKKGSAYDPFPGTKKVTSYSPYINYPITEITERKEITKWGEQRVIRFRFMGGVDEKYTVKFDTRQNGVVSVAELTEDEAFGGVILPDVEPNEGLTFIGWSSDGVCLDADAGYAGQPYYPKSNCRLFAVYQDAEGEVVADGREYWCVEESASKFVDSPSQPVTLLDAYTEKRGWSGSMIFCDNASIKIGEEGELISPKMAMKESVEVSFVAYSTTEGAKIVISSELYEGTLFEQELTAEPTLYTFRHEGTNSWEQYRFALSQTGVFNIRNITICGINTTSVKSVKEGNDLVIYRLDNEHSALEGAAYGSEIECYDATGKLLWRTKATTTPFQFSRPNGFYILKVANKAVKGI